MKSTRKSSRITFQAMENGGYNELPLEFFICGWKDMVDEARKTLFDIGFDKKQVKVESTNSILTRSVIFHYLYKELTISNAGILFLALLCVYYKAVFCFKFKLLGSVWRFIARRGYNEVVELWTRFRISDTISTDSDTIGLSCRDLWIRSLSQQDTILRERGKSRLD